MKVDDLINWRTKSNIPFDKISFESLPKGDWNFSTGNSQRLLEKLNTNVTLESITDRIFQGLKTSADKIYIVIKIEETKESFTIFCPQNEKTYNVEKHLFHPLIKGGDSLGYVFDSTPLLILFPYANSTLIPEPDLKKSYPSTYNYLKDHKTYLENRENGKMKTPKWYGFVYPKALDVISTPKIFTPDIASKASYSIDQKGDLFFTGGVSGGYGIKVKTNISELFVIGLLNSKLLEWYVKQISTQMRGGWYSFEAKYIKHLPIVIPGKEQQKMEKEIIALVETIIKLKSEKQSLSLAEKEEQLNQRISYTGEKINNLVYELYGLSDEEIEILEGRK